MSYRSDPENLDFEEPSGCSKFLKYTWKTVTCIFSHFTLVTMVVSYCILGAHTFMSLESENELNVRILCAILSLKLSKRISGQEEHKQNKAERNGSPMEVSRPGTFSS